MQNITHKTRQGSDNVFPILFPTVFLISWDGAEIHERKEYYPYFRDLLWIHERITKHCSASISTVQTQTNMMPSQVHCQVIVTKINVVGSVI